MTTDHFAIHYSGALVTPANPDRILQNAVGDLAANAERAYDLFVTSWSYPAPRPDPDGKVHIWVQKQATGKPLAVVYPETPAPTVWVSIDPTKAQDAHFASFIVMSAIESGMWSLPSGDNWLYNASSEWAAYTAAGYADVVGATHPPDVSLDCNGDACGLTYYDITGDSRWYFFQYLSERFGSSIVKETFAKAASLNDSSKTGRDVLGATLADKGTTLAAVFNDFTAAHVGGTYAAAGLKGAKPTTYATTELGLVTATFPARKVNVNHLAARYLKFTRDTSNTGQCYGATLSLTVALPAGSLARPSLFASSLGTTAVPLTVSGGTASISVPWSTCAGGGDAYLALPNPSLTTDGQTFVVGAALTVSNVLLTPPSTPPVPAYSGPTVTAPDVEVAPSILVHGAGLVRVPAATRLVRLLVFSSGVGQLRASVDSTVVATVALRPGNNDVRFVLPIAAVKSVRNVSGARGTGSTLSLTSLTSDGATAGETVTRAFVVTQPPKKKTASRR